MGFRKHGEGEILLDETQKKTAASKDWTEKDQAALDAENASVDKED